MVNKRAARRKRSRQRQTTGVVTAPPVFPVQLAELPESAWKEKASPQNLIKVLRSRRYMVQVYEMSESLIQLICQRVSFRQIENKATETITWSEMQRLKAESGYADMCAVEIFPPVESMLESGARHLWVYLKDVPNYMAGAKQWREARNTDYHVRQRVSMKQYNE